MLKGQIPNSDSYWCIQTELNELFRSFTNLPNNKHDGTEGKTISAKSGIVDVNETRAISTLEATP